MTKSIISSASRMSASPTVGAPRSCTASRSTFPPARPSRSWGTAGAGKSTIAKLLARFYDPTAGAITVNGTDLRHVTQESLRRQLGIVPQEGFLFAGTVAENISFGRPDATREEVESAARAVGAEEFIRATGRWLRDAARGARDPALARTAAARRVRPCAARRSEGPDPRRGDELGGHRHRANDRASRCSGSCTAARRSSSRTGSTIREADLIVVLEHGMIVEQGTHDELLAARGLYPGCTATGPRRRLRERGRVAMSLDRETEKRIEQPVSAEAERETRLSPAEAIAQMRIRVPVRANRKLRTLIERVNQDPQLKGWWHVSNVNAVAQWRSTTTRGCTSRSSRISR